jgi:hypothetical protein
MAKEKTVLFLDTSLGLDHALRYAKDSGEKPFYYMASISAYPTLKDSISGYGFEEIIKTYDWAGIMKKVDTVIFLDSGFSSLVDTMRQGGYNVFGASADVEKLEFDRIYFREVMMKIGIKTTDAEVIHGVDNVMDFLKKHKDEKFFIKLNKFRGDVETFGSHSAEEAATLLYPSFPVMGDEMDFILEKEIEGGIEIGCDAFFNGERFLKTYFFTCEQKGCGNMSLAVNKSVFDETLEKLTPYLKENNYHGAFCFEGFYLKNKEFLFTDPTPRCAFPCSSQWALAIKNYDEFLRGIASGIIDDFKVFYPYQMQQNFFAGNPKQWREIIINDKDLKENKQRISLRKAVKTDGHYYFVPDDDLMLSCNGAGESWEEAIKNALECAEMVSAYQSASAIGSETFFQETLDDLKGYGIELTPVEVKTKAEELDVRGKLEQIEAKLVHVVRPNKPDLLIDTDPDASGFTVNEEYCACEAPINENGTCTACGKKINAELNRKDTMIPKPKEELYNG